MSPAADDRVAPRRAHDGVAPRRGRRPAGSGDAREEILAAARTLFGERGFDAASLRAVGERAGVDPSLIHHYFGSKRGLFMAALEIPFDAADATRALAGVRLEAAAEPMLRYALSLWDGPHRDEIAALLRSALGDERSSTAMQDVLLEGIVHQVLSAVGVPEDEVVARAGLAEVVIIGLITLRTVMKLPVVRDLDADQVVAIYAPMVQHCLTAPLTDLGVAPTDQLEQT